MQCPACGHERSAPLLRCSNCGRTFPREPLEQSDRIRFVLRELDEWRRLGLIPATTFQRLEQRYLNRLRELEDALGPAAAPAAIPELAVAPPAVEPVPVSLPEAVPLVGPAGEPIPTTAVAPIVPEPIAPGAGPAAAPAPLHIPRPQISWEMMWRALLSPRSLEALLYVGAFLIVVAAGTFVLFNWGRFSPALQLLFLGIFTSSFFTIGWQLRTRWRLMQSGLTFIGIGALIIPVDFFAWARFRDLPPESYATVWLIGSLVCAAAYAVIVRWIRHLFFLVITLAAVHSALLAGLRLLQAPFDWWAAPTMFLAAAWAALEPRLDRLGPRFGPAAIGTAGLVAIAGLVTPAIYHRALLASVISPTWTADYRILPLAATWWAGTVVLLAARWHDRRPAGAYAVAVAVPVALVLTLLAVIPRPWISLALVALALLYSLTGRGLPAPLAHGASRTRTPLLAIGLLWALQAPYAIAVTYLAGTAVFAWWTGRFRQPILALAAQATGLVGVLALLHVADIARTFWPMGIAAAGMAGLAVAAAARPVSVRWHLYLGSYAQVALAVLVSFPEARVTQVAVLGGALGVAAYSSVLSHTRRDPGLNALMGDWGVDTPVFQWVAAALAAADLAVAWLWVRQVPAGLAAAGLVLATGYVVLARRLSRLRPAYARPWNRAGFALSLVAIALAIALQRRDEITATLLLATAIYALWAWLRDDARFLHLAAALFLAPFVLLLPQMRTWGLLASREAYALAFSGLGAAYLVAGAGLDLRRPGYAGMLHLISNLLIPFALLWSLQEEDVARATLTIAIPFYAVSAWLAHRGRHPTFLAVVRRMRGTTATALRALFVYAAAWLFPFWFHLTLHHVPLVGDIHARLGVAAAALAWVYLGLGQRVAPWDAVYVPPFRIAAQALAVVGGLLAADQRPLVIAALVLGVALQTAFYRVTGQIIWVYTTALGGAGLAGVILRQFDVPSVWAGGALLGLAAGYLGIAEVPWRRSGSAEIPPSAAALYAVAFVVAAIGLLLASFRGPWGVTAAYTLGALIFGWAARRLREGLLAYGSVGLLAAAYVAGLVGLARLRDIPAPPYGLWLAPGIVALFVVARLLHRRSREHEPAALAASWAGACYAAAHVGTVAMMVHSVADPRIFPIALALGALAYGVSAAIFRSPAWLYPALLTAHGAVFFGLVHAPIRPAWIPATFVPLTLLLALTARRLDPEMRLHTLRRLSWSQPLAVLALADLALWELAGVLDAPVHLGISLAFALLVATHAQWWNEVAAAWLALVLGVIAAAEGLRWAGASYLTVLVAVSLLALALGGAAVGLRLLGRGTVWEPGARGLALILSGSAVAAAVGGTAVGVHPDAGTGLVYTLAIVGLLYLLFAIADRRDWLGYVAVGMLETAWGLFLLRGLQVREIQWYAIPAALYLLGIGAVEHRRRRRRLAQTVDIAGLLLLFGSSLWQSVQPDGFRYAVLLAAEGLLVIWLGAVQRVRRQFFAGLAALIVNVAIQAINPLRALDKTVLFLSLGILLVGIAVLAERRREEIIRTTRQWWTRLEAWD